MKLLVVTTVAVTLKAFLLPHARYFRKRGWTVDGAAADVSRCESCREVFDETFDIPFSRNPLHFRRLRRAAEEIRALVERKGYDVVHVHTPVAAFVTRLALRHLRARGKVKVVYTAHGFHFYRGGPFFSNLLYRALEKRAAGWTDHLFVINEEDCEAACSFLSADRVTCLQGGVGLDLSEYDPRSVTEGEIAALRGEMGLKEGEPLFLMVGEFNANKRQADLIRAFAAMRPGKERPHLAFAGTGPAEEPMRQLARRLGVAERVHFLGFRRDVKALLKAATALILPSQREGLPRCLMEAIVMGAPIIGSDTRGTRDLVRLAGGRLFPVGDVTALAEAMEGAVGASFAPLPDEGVRALFCAEECAGRVYRTAANLATKDELKKEVKMTKTSKHLDECQSRDKKIKTNKVFILISGRSLEGGGGTERRFLRAFNEFQSKNDKKLDVNLIINESLFFSAQKLKLLNKEDNISIYKERKFFNHLFFTFFIIKLIINGPITLHLALIQKRLCLLYLFLKYFRKKANIRVIGTISSYLFAYRINLKMSDKVIYNLFKSCLDGIDSLYPRIQIDRNFTVTPCPCVDYNKFMPKDKKNNAVFAGRLIKEKNPMLFLEAINIVLNEKKNERALAWKFYVLGDGPLRIDLLNYVKRNDLSSNVEFVKGDTSCFLGNSQIFVSLQEYENYPSQSLLEAIACENVIIATDVGDTRELFKNSYSAIFIQPKKEDLAQALEDVIKNPELLLAEAKRTRAKVMANNNFSIFIKYLKNLWLDNQDLCDSKMISCADLKS